MIVWKSMIIVFAGILGKREGYMILKGKYLFFK